MKSWSTIVCTGLAILTAHGLCAETVYKWSDAEGKVIYSQTPPASGIDYIIVEQHYPKENTSTKNSSSSVASLSEAASPDETATDAKSEKERLAESQKIKEENCAQVKRNLNSLTSRGQVTIKDGDLYRKLTEEERQEKISENEQLMNEFCN